MNTILINDRFYEKFAGHINNNLLNLYNTFFSEASTGAGAMLFSYLMRKVHINNQKLNAWAAILGDYIADSSIFEEILDGYVYLDMPDTLIYFHIFDFMKAVAN